MERYVEFVKAIVEFVDKLMDFGEATCPFCDHHYNHDAGCLYLDARRLLAADDGTGLDKLRGK